MTILVLARFLHFPILIAIFSEDAAAAYFLLRPIPHSPPSYTLQLRLISIFLNLNTISKYPKNNTAQVSLFCSYPAGGKLGGNYILSSTRSIHHPLYQFHNNDTRVRVQRQVRWPSSTILDHTFDWSCSLHYFVHSLLFPGIIHISAQSRHSTTLPAGPASAPEEATSGLRHPLRNYPRRQIQDIPPNNPSLLPRTRLYVFEKLPLLLQHLHRCAREPQSHSLNKL